MKVECWVIGKTGASYLRTGEDHYRKKLRHYIPFSWVVLPGVRRAGNRPSEQLRDEEGKQVLDRLRPGDWLVLLDERGKTFTSQAFSRYLNRRLQHAGRRLIFLVGGAWGFSQAVYERADEQVSLSSMTFSHQMVRLFLLEQLYRGLSILRNEPYHNP